MTRLIKFVRSQYPGKPDYINPAHIRVINFDTEFASIDTTGDNDIIVTVAEAHRIIGEINGFDDAESPAAADVRDRLAAQDIEAANQRFNAALPSAAAPAPSDWFPERAHFHAPDQPDTSLAAFKAMLKGGSYVVLDTETTGLERGEIVQIAVVSSFGNVLLDTLVKPKEPIPADATRIHGISDEMVKDAPTWETVRRDVFYAIAGRHCVVYNAVYDRKMMHQSAERWGMVKLDWKEYAAFWCAMTAFAEIYGDWNEYRGNFKWQKLETAAHYYKIPEQGQAHTALADCLTTLAVCKAIAGA